MGYYFLDENSNYYQSTDDIATPSGHTAVTDRPSIHHTWDGSGWVDSVSEADKRTAWRAERTELRITVVERMIADDPTNTSRTAELEAWALQNQIPTSAQAIFDALPLTDKAAAMRNEVLQRNSPLIGPFAAVYGYTTDVQIDTLFGWV